MVPEKGYLGLTYVMIAGGEQTVLVQKLYRGRWRNASLTRLQFYPGNSCNGEQ